MQNSSMKLLRLKKKWPQIYSGDWDTIQQHIRNEFAEKTAATFVTMQHGLCMGGYSQGNFIMPKILPLDPQYIRSIRVFDADRECYVWRSSMDVPGIFRMRIIHDQEESDAEEIMHTIEVRQLLWGKTLKQPPAEPGWGLWIENRGIELLIHHSLLPDDRGVTPGNRLWLITRNYICYNDSGQAGYGDCRFVEIREGGGTWNA